MNGGVAAITGAAGAAGREVARVLAERGFSLALGGRDKGRLAEVAGDLGLDDDRVTTTAVDVTDLDSARRWADATHDRFGRVDALVHLVGGWRGGKPIAESPPEDDTFLLDSLVRTVQNATRAFLPALTESGGRFVLVSSPQAERPSHTNAAYGAAKAAAEAWTLALAEELGGHGGTANIVRVSFIKDPAPVADAIARLLSDDAADTNGARVIVEY
jgi:NAD(P)-dependent dehydrogenase (short-subunit alcohol dehydrogenase family)